jgi:hypothetical protein
MNMLGGVQQRNGGKDGGGARIDSRHIEKKNEKSKLI